MPLIRPFAGLRPTPQYAAEVLSPPYDVVTSIEARRLIIGKPRSFLHVSRPEIDMPPDVDPYDASVYEQGAENFSRLIDTGVLVQDKVPVFYAYRLASRSHTQTGLVAVASVSSYQDGRIRRHERTRQEKEDDRVHHITALQAQTGPVLLFHRHDLMVEKLLQSQVHNEPVLDITADDGVRHCLWVISDSGVIRALTTAFDELDCLYIADGHHRTAAAERYASEQQRANSSNSGREYYNYFLSVIFQHTEMQVLSYNRVIIDLGGMDSESFLARVAARFKLQKVAAPCNPRRTGEFGLYHAGQWYRLDLVPEFLPDVSAARLNVNLLADNLLAPILDIIDQRQDKRINFVGGGLGLSELEKQVDSGAAAVGIALYPTSISELMDVADADEIMPPKSTWFEPKLADGLVSHLLRNL